MDDEAKSYTECDCTVYLVDDDEDDRKLFSEALEEVGRNVQLNLFSGGEDLLNELLKKKQLPNIIFLDLYMPRMDGEECLARIRANEKLDSVCVIMYSTVMDLERIEELFNAGANRYLKKPSSYPALKKALDKAIESVRKNPLGGQAVINYSE